MLCDWEENRLFILNIPQEINASRLHGKPSHEIHLYGFFTLTRLLYWEFFPLTLSSCSIQLRQKYSFCYETLYPPREILHWNCIAWNIKSYGSYVSEDGCGCNCVSKLCLKLLIYLCISASRQYLCCLHENAAYIHVSTNDIE